MEVVAAAQRWADVLRDAWPAGEVERFAELYTDAAMFCQPPRVPEPAAAYSSIG